MTLFENNSELLLFQGPQKTNKQTKKTKQKKKSPCGLDQGISLFLRKALIS